MQAAPTIQATVEPTGCCQRFDPSPWQDQEITWTNEPFVKDHVLSVFHVPLRFGKHVMKTQALIEAAGAVPAVPLMLSDERSPWGSDLYIRVSKSVPGARMASLSGRFLTRVYEGPFRDAPKWAANMRDYVATRGSTLERLYFAYTTCPACAKAYGRNYVVLLARVVVSEPCPERERRRRGLLRLSPRTAATHYTLLENAIRARSRPV